LNHGLSRIITDFTDLVSLVFLISKSLKASFITLACQRPEVALRCNIFEADQIASLLMNKPAGAFCGILSLFDWV